MRLLLHPPSFRHLRHHHGYKHNEKRRKNKGKSKGKNKGEASARGWGRRAIRRLENKGLWGHLGTRKLNTMLSHRAAEV